jgi:hypothetical protein
MEHSVHKRAQMRIVCTVCTQYRIAAHDTSVFIDVRLSNLKITFHEIFVLIKFSYLIQRFCLVVQVFITGIGLDKLDISSDRRIELQPTLLTSLST